MQDIEKVKSKYLRDSDRHSAMVNKKEYMDMLADEIKVKPDWWTLMWTDPYLCYKCIFGPLLPYQYRLVGRFRRARSTVRGVRISKLHWSPEIRNSEDGVFRRSLCLVGSKECHTFGFRESVQGTWTATTLTENERSAILELSNDTLDNICYNFSDLRMDILALMKQLKQLVIR